MPKSDRITSTATPIAIVGIGCRFPMADDADAFWANIVEGRVAFSKIPKSRWNHDIFYSASQRDVDKAWTASGSFIDDRKLKEFAALHYGIAPRRLEVMDPQQRLLIEATRWALQDAGYERRGFPKAETGVFIGFSTSEFRNLSQARMLAMQMSGGDFGAAAGTEALRTALLDMTANIVPTRAFSLAGSLGALAAASVSQTFDLGGPAYTIDAACASALVAVHDAIGQLRSGLVDCAIAGGAYLNLTPENLVAFTRVGAISPSGVCRPFDARSDGFVQSDGIGVVVLRRLEDAMHNDDRIYAVIRGTGCNNDGRGDGPMSPRAAGQLAALRQAYRDAGCSPASVAYFEAHGTATSVGDPAEITALGSLLQEAGVNGSSPALLGSVKGNIGHAMSAAGIAGLIKGIKVLEQRVAPPQAGFESPNPELGLEQWPLRVLKAAEPLRPRPDAPLRVAVSSFGFGGTNAHVILEEPEGKKRPSRVARSMREAKSKPATTTPSRDRSPTEEPRPEAILVSAPTSDLLVAFLHRLTDEIDRGVLGTKSLADLAFTLNARRRLERMRAVIGAKDVEHLAANLRAAAKALSEEPFDLTKDVNRPVVASPHAVVYDAGRDPSRPKVALLFPGQGAQRVGLLAALRERFPVFRHRLDELDASVQGVLPKPLTAYVYPTDDARPRDALEADLTSTEVCQPAMAALGLSTAALLESVGVVADVSLGHSLGEFSALANAKALLAEDAVRLVAKRGLAMKDLSLEDPGTMAAVMADPTTVEHALLGVPDVYLANINHPRQTAVSGSHAGVAALTKKLDALGIEVRPLPVSHAFHSPLLLEIKETVEELVDSMTLRAPEHVAASCIAPEPHTEDLAHIRQVMIDHSTARVDFVRGLEQARRAGATVYVQAGAGSMLTAFARSTLGDDILTVTLASLDDDGGYEMIRGLCTLAAVGVPVDFEAVYRDDDRQVISLPETPLERETYWVVRNEPQPRAVLDYPFPEEGSVPIIRLGGPSTGQELAPQALSRDSKAEDARPPANEALVQLFAKQAEVLRSHADIIVAQNRVLLGEAPPASLAGAAGVAGSAGLSSIESRIAGILAEAPKSGAAGSPSLRAEPRADETSVVDRSSMDHAPKEPDLLAATSILAATSGTALGASEVAADQFPSDPVAEVSTKVFEIVARISAFPTTALRREQRLIDELGFDSLMVADLGGALEKAYPESGGIPASLFKLDTTVGDLIEHLAGLRPRTSAPAAPRGHSAGGTATSRTEGAEESARAGGGEGGRGAEGTDGTGETAGIAQTAGTEDNARPKGPISFYRPAARARRPGQLRTHDVRGETWLVTEDGSSLSAAISANLEGRGAEIVRVRFVDDGVAAADRLTAGALNLWPSAFVSGLSAALTQSSMKVAGFVHAAGLSVSATDDLVNPVLTLHPIVSQLDVPRITCVTALGGKLGLSKTPVLGRNVLQASLAGYTKALARERPSMFIRAIDVDPAEDATRTAALIVEETLSPDLQREVGFALGARWLPELVREDVDAENAARRKFDGNDIVLITGGAGEIARVIALEVARSHPKAILLVGRRPEDDSIRELLAAITACDTVAHYVAADLTRPASLRDALGPVLRDLGPITVAIHAAGIIEDAPASKKTLESIERVMDVKIRGLQSLVAACPKLRDVVLFTSWAGRFGNASQTDYAAANDLLDHIAINGLGGARTVAVAWPPWSSTKMVRSIPAMMRRAMESEGVTFLDDVEGVSAFRDIFEAGLRGAVLVGRDLPARDLGVDRVVSFRMVDHPYLDDHRLKGEPVVPLASATDLVGETFASVAHGPGALEITNLELVAGIRGDDEVLVTLRGRHFETHDEAKVEVRVRRHDDARGRSGQVAYRARLSTTKPDPRELALELDGQPIQPPISIDSFYRDHTFHGPRLRGIESITRMTDRGIQGSIASSRPASWMPHSGRDRWTVDPLVVDGSFQLAAYWLHVHRQQAGYPIGFDRLILLRPFPEDSVHATVVLRAITADSFEGDILYEDVRGHAFGLLKGVRGRIADLATAAVTGTQARAQARAPATSRVSTQAGAQTETSSATPAAATSATSAAAPAATLSATPSGTQASAPSDPQPRHAAHGGNGHGAVSAEVPSEHWKVSEFPELESLGQRLEMAKLIGLRNPYFHVHSGTAKNVSVIDDVEMLNYSSYNYLGFSGHPEVVKAAQDAIARYGTSVSASRVASGERPVHRDLEAGIAQHLGVDDAIVFVSGHATNVTTIGHLFDENDVIFHDSLIHDSILQGIALSKAQRRPYPHGDLAALERLLGQLRGSYRRALLCAEGIYSMDGDICDLPRLIELKKRWKTLLLIDEAHSIGVLGPSGRGVGHHFTGVEPRDVDLWMGTLSKSFASCGGYIAGSKDLVRYLKYTAPGFVYSAGITPPNAAAALKSLELMKRHPEIVERLRQRSKLFLDLAKARGLDTGLAVGAAVVPIIVGNSLECMRLSERLATRAINVQPIVYPAVEDNASRLRFFLSALHTEEQIHHTVSVVAEELANVRRELAAQTAPSVST